MTTKLSSHKTINLRKEGRNVRRFISTTLLLIVPLFLTGCSLKKPKVQTTDSASVSPKVSSLVTNSGPYQSSSYLQIEPSALDEQINANYAQAQEKVKLWHDNAVLYHVAVKFPNDLKPGFATEVYTYGSSDDAYNWWTLNISLTAEKSVRAIIPKEDYLGTTLEPVPLQHWKMNYGEALQLADSHGGAAYRAAHPETKITANLAVGEPKNFLWWSVEYEATAAETLKILVNPSTKEVITPSPSPTP
jgi:hypothetical protein